MKKYLLFTGTALVCLFYACSKSNPAPANNSTTTTTTTPPANSGITVGANGYTVRTIGISRILVGTDKNSKITVATLYGGGNKIILKAGTGNSMEFQGANIATLPDALGNPDAQMPYLNQPIDNGNAPQDTTGTNAVVIKLKGFNKQVTGYNQLNLVMCKQIWAMAPGEAGYYTNLTYLTFTRRGTTSNVNYEADFLKTLFAGSISVTYAEIAPPKSASSYITEDQILSSGDATYDTKSNQPTWVDLTSLFYRVLFTSQAGFNVGSPLKFQWVNADNGTIKKTSDYSYSAYFSNIKTGGFDQVVDPVDSTNKVFLRVTGFDPAITGYNQLRIFLASDGFYDSGLQVVFTTIPTTAPTLSFIKSVYNGSALNCNMLSPQWPHY